MEIKSQSYFTPKKNQNSSMEKSYETRINTMFFKNGIPNGYKGLGGNIGVIYS
jgi:hypothetical protein